MNAAIVERASLTEALKQLLLEETDRPGDVGRAPKPAAGKTAPSMPYWILDPIDGGGFTGPAQAEEADAVFVYQLSWFGERGDQLERAADRGRAAIFTRGADGAQTPTLDVGGLTVQGVGFDSGGGMDFETPVGSVVERYAFYVTTS